jgi:hypothetical protein
MFISLLIGFLIAYLALLELWLIHFGLSAENHDKGVAPRSGSALLL